MKRYVIILVVLLIIFTFCFSVSAQILDPAQEYKEELLKYGLDLDTMPTEIEELENGDQKIWHIDYSGSVYAFDEYTYNLYAHTYRDVAGGIENWTYILDRNHPTRDLIDSPDDFLIIDGQLVDGIRYYFSEIPAGSCIYGDSNKDSSVDLKDVLTTRSVLAGHTVEQYDSFLADTNWDDLVDMKDILQTRQYIAGIINRFGNVD